MAIYVTSDLHFCHDRFFIYEPRGFRNVTEYNEGIIRNWNNTISDEDDVYVLGDLVLTNLENGISCISRLKGRIHLIRGNHDSDVRISEYAKLPNVVEIVAAAYLKCKGLTFYLSHYPTIVVNNFNEIVLKREVINLFGHTHSADKFYRDADGNAQPLMYNVSLDAHNCTPIKLDDIANEVMNIW